MFRRTVTVLSLLVSLISASTSTPILLSYYPAFLGINPSGCDYPFASVTHFSWAFAGADGDGNLTVPSAGLLDEFVDSVLSHGNTPLLSLGGENSIGQFAAVMHSDSSVDRFTDSLVSYCMDHRLGGVEINWEGEALMSWSAAQSSMWPVFSDAYAFFAKTLGAKLHSAGMTVGVDVYGGAYYAAYFPGGEDSSYINILDRMLVMTGGVHGLWDLNLWKSGAASQPSALAPGNYETVQEHVAYWTDRQVPRSKIVASLVSSFSGYNVMGAGDIRKPYSDLGTHCDGQGFVYYPQIFPLIESGEFSVYGGGAQGSFLYSAMDEADSSDDEIILFNSRDDMRFMANDLVRSGIGGIGYWMPALDLSAQDPLCVEAAIAEGMTCDTAIPEPLWVDKPTASTWNEPQGAKMNLMVGANWVPQNASGCSSTVNVLSDSINAVFVVAQKSGPDDWPFAALLVGVGDSAKDFLDSSVGTIALAYRSTQSVIFSLNTDAELALKGWSHMVELPATNGETDTLVLLTSTFQQPAWTGGGGAGRSAWLRPLTMENLTSASFFSNGTFGKTTDLKLGMLSAYKSGTTAIFGGIGISTKKSLRVSSVPNGLALQGAAPGRIDLSVLSLSGRCISRTSIVAEPDGTACVNWNSMPARGVYLIQCRGTGWSSSERIVID